jgi:predicted GNAT family N-acyltransferase
MVRVREYLPADREACLAMFDGNVPAYFAPAERADYETFLAALDFPYLVIEDETGLVACGGWTRRKCDAGAADLCWGMVRHDRHKSGLGHALMQARLDQIAAAGGVRSVVLQTSQHTEGFFARYGFVTHRVETDGFAPGLHLHEMRLTLG